MDQLIQNAIGKKKIFFVITAIFILVSLVLGFTTSNGFFGLTIIVCLFATIYYISKIGPLISSKEYLDKWNMYSAISDINPKEYTLPKSKICCGRYVFYAAKERKIVPYRNIVWIYVTVQKSYGITVGRIYNFMCIDRKCFSMNVNKNEADALIDIIAKNAPNLILGYGREQQNAYNNLANQFEASRRNQM